MLFNLNSYAKDILGNYIQSLPDINSANSSYENIVNILTKSGQCVSKNINACFNTIASLAIKYSDVAINAADVLDGIDNALSIDLGDLAQDTVNALQQLYPDDIQQQRTDARLRTLMTWIDGNLLLNDPNYDSIYEIFQDRYGRQWNYTFKTVAGWYQGSQIYAYISFDEDETDTDGFFTFTVWLSTSTTFSYDSAIAVASSGVDFNSITDITLFPAGQISKFVDDTPCIPVTIVNDGVEEVVYVTIDTILMSNMDQAAAANALAMFGQILREKGIVDSSDITRVLESYCATGGEFVSKFKSTVAGFTSINTSNFISIARMFFQTSPSAEDQKVDFFSAPKFLRGIWVAIKSILSTVLNIVMIVLKGVFQVIAGILYGLYSILSSLFDTINNLTQLSFNEPEATTAVINFPIGSGHFESISNLSYQAGVDWSSGLWTLTSLKSDGTYDQVIPRDYVCLAPVIYEGINEAGFIYIDNGPYILSVFQDSFDQEVSENENTYHTGDGIYAQMWIKAAHILVQPENYVSNMPTIILTPGGGSVASEISFDLTAFEIGLRDNPTLQANFIALSEHDQGIAILKNLAATVLTCYFQYLQYPTGSQPLVGDKTDEFIAVWDSSASGTVSTATELAWLANSMQWFATPETVGTTTVAKLRSNFWTLDCYTDFIFALWLNYMAEHISGDTVDYAQLFLDVNRSVLNDYFNSHLMKNISGWFIEYGPVGSMCPGSVRLPSIISSDLKAIATIAAITTAVTVLGCFTLKRVIKSKATSRLAKREAAFESAKKAYSDDPSAANEKALYKANRKLTRAWNRAGSAGLSMYNGFDCGGSSTSLDTSNIEGNTISDKINKLKALTNSGYGEDVSPDESISLTTILRAIKPSNV